MKTPNNHSIAAVMAISGIECIAASILSSTSYLIYKTHYSLHLEISLAFFSCGFGLLLLARSMINSLYMPCGYTPTQGKIDESNPPKGRKI